jgi:hypothetical protein
MNLIESLILLAASVGLLIFGRGRDGEGASIFGDHLGSLGSYSG